jgi:hypothetical protein
MPNVPDRLDEFLRKLDPIMQSTQLRTEPDSGPVYRSLELSCIAARQGNEWVLVSGKATLNPFRDECAARLGKVAALDEIVAFQGCLPGADLNSWVTNLRNSWVLEKEGIRLAAEGTCGYSWMPPRTVKIPGLDWDKMLAVSGGDIVWRIVDRLEPLRRLLKPLEPLLRVLDPPEGMFEPLEKLLQPYESPFEPMSQYMQVAKKFYRDEPMSIYKLLESRYWLRRFELCGEGPNPLSHLSEHTLQAIDRQLIGGFAGLCKRLGLPDRRSNPASAFQISAELPAGIGSVLLGDELIMVNFYSLGSPEPFIQWDPNGEPQPLELIECKSVLDRRFSDGRLKVADIAFGELPRGARQAQLSLCFGKLEADSATVDLHAWKPRCWSTTFVELEIRAEEPTGSDSAPLDARLDQPAVLKPATGENDVTPERPTVSDSATEGSPNQPEPPSLAARKVPNKKPKKRRRPPDPASDLGKRRAIAKANPSRLRKKCLLLEDRGCA